MRRRIPKWPRHRNARQSRRHEVQLQIVVDASQDLKDNMDNIFERRERTPPKEDRLGEDFQEDPDRGKGNQKTPLEVKQQNK